MKLKFVSYFLFVLLMVSCNNHKTINKENSPVSCYKFANSYDTVTLKLIHVGESITGTLVYNLNGKDKNMGTVQGGMRGDLFVANYTFISEGIQSIRQIAFKKEKNYFIEGYGDVNQNTDMVSFKNIDSLQFNDNIKLMEIDCQK